MMNIAEFRNSTLLQLEYSLKTGRSVSNLLKRSANLHGNTQFDTLLNKSISNSSPINLLNEDDYMDIYTKVIKNAAKDIAELEAKVNLTFIEMLDSLYKIHNTTELFKIFDLSSEDKWATATKGELKPLLIEFRWWFSSLVDLNLIEGFESAQDVYDFLDKPLFKQLKRLSEIVEVVQSNWILDKSVYENILDSLNNHSENFIDEWLSKAQHTGHFNALTRREYKSLYSWIFLDFVISLCGYQSNVWATKKQWKKKGFEVKEGAKIAPVFHYFKVYENVAHDGGYSDPKLVNDFGRKVSLVYNSDEVIDYDGNSYAESKVVPLETIDQRVEELGIRMSDGNLAGYHFLEDYIEMPRKELFKDNNSTKAYYATLLHEMVHWTGHDSRLARNLSSTFGDVDYAFEELVAEIGSSFLCSRFGLVKQVREQSIAYIKTWLTKIDQSKKLKQITDAAKLANQASNYIYLPSRDDHVRNVYHVELITESNVEIFYEFSEQEIEDADSIEEAFDTLIYDMGLTILLPNISISLVSSPRRNAKHTYKLRVYYDQNYSFEEECLDGDELVDGCCDRELDDMKKQLAAIFEFNGYEVEIVDLILIDEVVLEKETIPDINISTRVKNEVGVIAEPID